MNKGILKRSVKAVVAFFILFNTAAYAQAGKAENTEKIIAHWHSEMRRLRTEVGGSRQDVKTFVKFYQQRIDSEYYVFLGMVEKGQLTMNNIDGYISVRKAEYISLFAQFEKIKKEYPSSISEYTSQNDKPMGTCNPGCTNIDFEDGTLNGWNAYYAVNNSDNANYPTSSFTFTGVVGGPAGAVTQAGGPDPGTNNDYQIKVMSGSGTDALVPSIPVVSPFGGKYSVRMGDTTYPYQGMAMLSQTFAVTAANKDFIYEYAILLDNPPPSNRHNYYQQPFFTVTMFDQNGDTIHGCGQYVVASSLGPKFGFKALPWSDPYDANEQDTVYYKPWTFVFVPLNAYIGQCVTIQFTSADCSLGGHFGYAYVDASCSGLGIASSSPAFCGQKTITLTAPIGAAQYQWSGPAGGIVGSVTTQTVQVDSAGTYKVVVTPVTGTGCNDTLSITIPKLPGPPPVPSFTADTVCLGSATQFTNTSSPDTAGDKFYWDFYGLGYYQDSTQNPSVSFNSAGVYSVTLHEVTGGCGADTTIKIKVDSNAKASFTAGNACVGQPVSFVNNSTNSTTYSWNFGDGGTSSAANPTYTYAAGGTYTVTLVAGTGACFDSTKQVITISSPPVMTITGNDSICSGSSTILSANGATNGYTWNPGGMTGSSVTVSPSSTTTYTITGTNGMCSADTMFTVYVQATPVPVITASSDTICTGNSTKLWASGGTTYVWTPGSQTSDTISVSPGNTTVYSVNATTWKCSASASFTVTVLGNTPISLTLLKDSICPGDTTILVANGGVHYLWSNGATTSSVKVAPGSSTTYSVTLGSKCTPDTTLTQVVHVVPLPVVSVTGNDSVCPGTSTVLTASGGTTYMWSTGSSSTSITVTPTIATTYTVTASNGKCFASATYTVKVAPIPIVTVVGPNSVCAGDSVTLNASGGGTYSWNNGATTSSITVPVANSTNFYVVVTKGCADTTYHPVTAIPVSPVSACCDTTVLPGTTVSLNSWGATGYVWSPSGGVDCYTCPSTNAVITGNPGDVITYTVVGTDVNGCHSVAYIKVSIECQNFVVPNVFTPNGDAKNAINDFFTIQAIGEPQYTITIYDRWGRKVFTSSDPSQPWNGRMNNTGADAPAGVYYYIIKSSCDNNNYDKHGFVQLIRSK